MTKPMSKVPHKVEVETTEISVRGEFRRVPAIELGTVTIAMTGRFLRTGFIKGEGWLDPSQVEAPERIIDKLRQRKAPLDLFRFRQQLPDVQQKFDFHCEWEDIAAIPLTSFEDWWENRASQVTRKNVRRSVKRGIDVRLVDFDDRLIESITRVNNDTPFRTGRKFWHYGKDFSKVKKDYSSYLDRSEFLGAFFSGDLVGFLRLIYQGDVVSIMQLLSMNAHYDKRPSNALVAKAVERSLEKGAKFLVYGQYFFDEDADNPLTEFKRRNGFERILVPAYYVPLSLRGKIAIKLNVHAGLRRLIPNKVIKIARMARDKVTKSRKEAMSQDPMAGE